MRLWLNGEPYATRGADCLSALLDELGVPAHAVATLLNDEVVPAAGRAGRRLQAGDRVELLAFAAGG